MSSYSPGENEEQVSHGYTPNGQLVQLIGYTIEDASFLDPRTWFHLFAGSNYAIFIDGHMESTYDTESEAEEAFDELVSPSDESESDDPDNNWTWGSWK